VNNKRFVTILLAMFVVGLGVTGFAAQGLTSGKSGEPRADVGAGFTYQGELKTSPVSAPALLNPEFQISSMPMPVDPERPGVIYNRKHNEYLVVWRADTSMLYGQRVSAHGIPPRFCLPIFIGSQPAVAYNAQDDQYLIVWSLDGLGSYTLL